MNNAAAIARIKADIRAEKRNKNVKQDKPIVHMPYVNYATGRLVWD